MSQTVLFVRGGRLTPACWASPARADVRSFPGRTHWLIARDGWQEVAQAYSDGVASLAPADSHRGSDEVGAIADDKQEPMRSELRVPAARRARFAA